MKRIINSDKAPAAVGPYSQAVEAGGTFYISGQLPLDPATGKMPEGVEAQTEQVFANIAAILAEAGYTFDHVVKSTVLLADMGDFAAMNAIYAKYYTGDKPARVCYAVKALPMGAVVEIETIAIK
jgi:2-iminobutanoate/2-iminopropanoate deaminase